MRISLNATMAGPADGFCPQCGAPVRFHMADKDQCWNGHVYPADETDHPTDVQLKIGDKVRIRPEKQEYERFGIVTEEKNQEDLIGVQVEGANPNRFGSYTSYYHQERLEKV